MLWMKMSLMSVNDHASNPSSSINFVTALITSLSRRSIEGFSTFLSMMLSTMPLSLEMRTPIRAQPLKRSHPSTTRPRPRVSNSIAPENIKSVYALKAKPISEKKSSDRKEVVSRSTYELNL